MLTDEFIAEWTGLALEMAAITGQPMTQHLDEAYDLVTELAAFAAIWDLCALSQLTIAETNEVPL